jgi:DNA-binding MarR family transcriptional regulator
MDAVDGHIEQWRAQRPDLPDAGLAAMAVIGRLGRLARVLGPAVESVFARHGLNTGEFDVLATLRRSGDPFTLTPGVLARELMHSPAATTNRLDRLEAAGLITRALDPGNRRSMLVTLTERGREVIDAAVVEHVANEQRLLAALDGDETAALDRALRALLADLEPGNTG